MGHRRTWLLVAALVAALAAGGAAWRVPRTAEWVARHGSPRQRADLCRVLPQLPAWRRTPLLRRALRDPADEVRSAAITAWERSPGRDPLTPLLRTLLSAADTPADLRTKAGLALLVQTPPDPVARDHVTTHAAAPAFRHAHGRLVARLAEVQLPELAEPGLRTLVAAACDTADPAHPFLQEIVRRHAPRFTPCRDEFLRRLQEPTVAWDTRQFLAACLGEIDGAMRGLSAADWARTDLAEADADAVHAVEAEWATEIQPNFAVGEHAGVRCLRLGEGAGGVIPWLRGHEGTVDVGSARLSLYAPQDGDYHAWARVFLDDKCGNSFGFWLDEQPLASFNDYQNELGAWHWLRLDPETGAPLRLRAGHHRARLEAWEDGVFLDAFALLPAGQTPAALPAAVAVRWDPALVPSVSVSPEYQGQPRGTTQIVVAWVRRTTPNLRGGTLELEVPPPFVLRGPSRADVRFDPGNPLARASFAVHLPATAVGGEVRLRAVYRDTDGTVLEGGLLLGAHFDWFSTGPLDPADARHLRLAAGAGQELLPAEWNPFPVAGYDPYRRLDPERAYGQLEDRYLYLCTDLDVTHDGTFLGLLNADDTARVWLDGQPVLVQRHGGPGEGRLQQAEVRLQAGRHRLFVQLYQAAGADPTGADAARRSANHCNLKLLLRRDRRTPAPEIRGLPHPWRSP